MDLANETIVVTGGAGFLGRNVQARLTLAGADESKILVPTIDEYDLTREADLFFTNFSGKNAS